MDRKHTLEAAMDAVDSRPKSYGPPEQNFDRIARRWNAHLENRYWEPGLNLPELDATDVAVMMADVKLARIEESPGHEDSWVDLAGYAACGAEVSTAQEEAPDVGDFGGPGPLLDGGIDRSPSQWWVNKAAPERYGVLGLVDSAAWTGAEIDRRTFPLWSSHQPNDGTVLVATDGRMPGGLAIGDKLLLGDDDGTASWAEITSVDKEDSGMPYYTHHHPTFAWPTAGDILAYRRA